MDISSMLENAKELVIMAGEKILEIYNSEDFDITEKKDQEGNTSPLTRADLAANSVIVIGLKESFPDIPILTEEGKDDKKRQDSSMVWIIDPLDGTKEFIKKNGEFTVNIALVQDGRPIIGVIYVPVTDELYYATEGKGSFYQDQGIKVSSTSDPKYMEIAVSRSHQSEKLRKLMKRFREAVVTGSSVKGCLVAKGEADLYPRLGPVNEWDICAMDIIIKEAGGRMTDLDGKELIYNQENPLKKSGFLASNNRNHNELLEIIKNG